MAATTPGADRASSIIGDGSSLQAPALVHQRTRVHLAFRLATRVAEVGMGWSRPGRRARIAAALACGVGDIAGASVLRSSDRLYFGPRLVLDALDTALWGRLDDTPDLSTLSGIPLAIESGIRLGPAGMIVPSVCALVTAIERRRRGRSSSPSSFRWQAMAVVVGIGLAWYEGNQRRVLLARHAVILEAQAEQMRLAGQNDVAMGADSVVDLLSRTTPLMRVGSQDLSDQTVGPILATWKASLASTTANHATYLGVVLAQWQRHHNEAGADLSADVVIDLKEGHGTIVLSSWQALKITEALETLNLRGHIEAWVVDPDQAKEPNRAWTIAVGVHIISVPADPRPELVPFDAGPVTLIAGCFWLLDSVSPGGSHTDPRFVCPMVVAGGVLAAWAHGEISRKGPLSHPRIVAADLGLSLAQSLVATSSMRRTIGSDGLQHHPAAGCLNMVGMMLPLYWSDLGVEQRIAALAAIVLIVATNLCLFPEPIRWLHLFMDLLWPLAAFVSMTSLGSALSTEAKIMSGQLAARDEEELRRAFLDGRSFVIALVSEARYAARQQFISVRSGLDPSIAAEVERRLDEIDDRLERL